MNPNSVSINNSLVFVQGQPSQVRGLSVEQWSMQSFMTEGVWTNFGRINSDLWLKPEGLVGTLRNETAYTLEDATLIMSSQFIRLGNLPAGAEMPVTHETVDQTFAANRQRFLTEQGYKYEILYENEVI